MEYLELSLWRGLRPIQWFLYYSHRIVIGPIWRQAAIALIKSGISFKAGKWQQQDEFSPSKKDALAHLTTFGYAPLQTLLAQQQLREIHKFLEDKPLKSRHRRPTQFFMHARPDDVGLAEYRIEDVINCPHILELANSQFLLELAARYLGCKPTISTLTLRWSFPRRDGVENLQRFHRDADDWRFFKVFVYLTDVDEHSGPHVCVKQTHWAKRSLRLQYYTDEEIIATYGTDRLMLFTGNAGFGFAVDTAGVHKGLAPQKQARLMLMIQYSLLPCFAYRYTPAPYQGALAVDRYINRLFLTTT